MIKFPLIDFVRLNNKKIVARLRCVDLNVKFKEIDEPSLEYEDECVNDCGFWGYHIGGNDCKDCEHNEGIDQKKLEVDCSQYPHWVKFAVNE